MIIRVIVLALLFVLSTTSCGTSKDTETKTDSKSQQAVDLDSDPTNITKSKKFDCQGDTCDSSHQYCLVTQMNEAVLTHSCVELPKSCKNCDCVTQDAPKQFPPTASNCSKGAMIACQFKDTVMSVTCTRSTF